MKIPSLTKLPSYRRFHIEPRYYDPIKEDIEERTSRIEQEIRQLGSAGSSPHSSIQGAFTRRSDQARDTNVLQFVIMAVLFTVIFGYIYYGNAVFYLLILAAPVYFLVRLRKYSVRGRTSEGRSFGEGTLGSREERE